MKYVEKQSAMHIFRDGQQKQEYDDVLQEHRMDIYVNDQLVMKVVCTPSYLKELVLGRLLTEQYISSIQEVDMVYLCDEGYRAKVFLKKDIKELVAEKNLMVPTCCTDNESVTVKKQGFQTKEIACYPWKTSWIFHAADIFAKDTQLHKKTMGTHSCSLFQENTFLVSCEDIGRHNAVDKVIGWAICKGIDLRSCMLYTSGRMPLDIVRKAIRAQVPVLIGKGVPTSQSVELAEMYGLTLIGAARSDRIKVYYDHSR